MSGQTQLYTLLFATVGNALLNEAQNVEIKRVGGGNIVMTLAKRFSGISPGSSMCTITVTSAVPASGMEVDFGSAIDGYIPTTVGIARADGKEASVTGFVMEDDIKQGVNQEATYTFTVTAPLPQFQ